MLEKTPNGIRFSEATVSINGTRFILFPELHHTKDDVKKAKSWIRNNRDATSISVKRRQLNRKG